MAKNKISEFSATASNNTDIGGINISEGCAPSGINNAIRELMAQLKDMQSGTDGDGFTVGGAFTCSGAAVFSSTVALGASATATTQSAGDNSTKVATTAYVTNSVAIAYPVGSIYINATNSTNPATLFGFGTWTAFGAGRVMVGFDSVDSLFNSAERIVLKILLAAKAAAKFLIRKDNIPELGINLFFKIAVIIRPSGLN